MWKGEDVGYTQLHRWVESRLTKPALCQRCETRKAYDLSNKGTYNRDLENWEWLCRRCHMLEDGRMINLKHSKSKYFKARIKPESLRESYIKTHGI